MAAATAILSLNVDANELLKQIGSRFPSGQTDFHRQQLPDGSIFASWKADGSVHAAYFHAKLRHRVSVVPGNGATPVRSWADAGKTAYVAHAASNSGGNTSHHHTCVSLPCNDCGN